VSSPATAPSVLWFRRDLRLADHPALLAARDAGNGAVLPLFVLDDALWEKSGQARRAFLSAALRSLSERMDGGLVVVHGDPRTVVPHVAATIGAASVHISADYGPYGRKRDDAVEKALQDRQIELSRTGSPYAVAPGRVTKEDGSPFKVFTPFSRGWRSHGWRAPAAAARKVDWAGYDGKTHGLPDAPVPDGVELPEATEAAALRRWKAFRDNDLTGYADNRNVPAGDHTSRMSMFLKWGLIHPRTLLADLQQLSGKGSDTYRTELCWREFYADVLFHRPETARENYNDQFDGMRWDTGSSADKLFEAWATGQTGFPIVDAAMRQLLGEGWMHNRCRMIVASFLVKDLHLDWRRGAAHFMQHLADGDLASNQHGWQWTAGSGTDAAPYYRVFNPVTQAKNFDPAGAYVRRWVPELRDVDGAAVHEPWTLPGGVVGYPDPVVDHAAERIEALDRFQALKD
jgi:deoxyribodipyrimidine photo-lyase